MADGLADIPEVELRLAAKEARDRCRWFPTVAELRAVSGRGHGDPKADAEAAALQAWEQALAWCRRYEDRLWRGPATGGYGDCDQGRMYPAPTNPIPPLPDRVSRALKSAGGPNRVIPARDDAAELKWCRRDFCEAYRLLPESDVETPQIGAGEAARIVAQLAAALPEVRG